MRHKKTHDKFAKMAARISMAEPPCMSNAEDWESQNGWVDEMGPLPEPDIGPPILPDGTTSEHLPVKWLCAPVLVTILKQRQCLSELRHMHIMAELS